MKRSLLRRLSNAEYEEVERLAEMSGIPLDQCPTCLSLPVGDEEAWGRENGQYKYGDEWHDCDCDTQIQLRKHYLLANIGNQYMRLNWDTFTDKGVKEFVQMYLDGYKIAKLNGMGLEFFGRQLGAGKTFCATHVGKELIKRGERVYFLDFNSAVNALLEDNGRAEKLRTNTYIILDEVVPAVSDKQLSLFRSKFEELIRHRTNHNLPTIITTNIVPEDLEEEFPRVYSLLAAKSMRTEITGEDARQGKIALENLELMENLEVKPIT